MHPRATVVATLGVSFLAVAAALFFVIRSDGQTAMAERCSRAGHICATVKSQPDGTFLLQRDAATVISAVATERIYIELKQGRRGQTAHIFATTSLYNRDTVKPDGDGDIRFTIELLPPGAYTFLVVQRTGDDDTPFGSWLFYVTIADPPDTFGIDDELRSELIEWLESEGLVEPE